MTSRNLYTEQQFAGKNGKKPGLIRALFLVGLMFFGVQAIAQSYTQVSNTSGTSVVNGITVTVTSSGSVSSSSSCGAAEGPYTLNGGSSSYTFTFSAPVGSVEINADFSGGGAADQMHFVRNGSDYTITSGNLAGSVGTCSVGTLAVPLAGNLANTGNTTSNPNNQVIIPGPITSITVSNIGTNGSSFGLFFTPSTYYQVTNTSGTFTIDGVTTTVTSTGDASILAPCSNTASPFLTGASSGTGQYNFSFSSAVDGINAPVIFTSAGITSSAHFAVNGSGVTLTTDNLNGQVQPNCGDPTEGVVLGGDLSNSGDEYADPSANVMLSGPATTLAVSSPTAMNGFVHGVFFTKGTTAAMTFDNPSNQTLALCSGAAATNIDAQLAVTDLNAGALTLTWTLVVPPANGTVVGSGNTALTTGSSVSPTGFTYQPTPGYTGVDGFTIQVSDGVNTATTTINATMSIPADVTDFHTAVSTVCTGADATVNITSSSLEDGTYTVTYNLTGANTAVASTALLAMSSGAGSFVTSALSNAGATNITITGVASSCSTGTPASGNTAVFTVVAGPSAIFNPGPVCAGSSISVSDGTSGGAYTTQSSLIATATGIGGSGSGLATVTGVNAGTTNLSYTITGTGCYTTSVITVNPQPAAITGSSSVCTGSTTGLTETTSGGSWTSSNTSVATIGSTTGMVTGVSAGTLTITYTLTSPSGNCISTWPMTVYQTPLPITGPTAVCTDFTIVDADGTSGGLFSSSNSAIASVVASGVSAGTVSGVATGTATISYTVPNGCYVTQSDVVNQTPDAIAGPTSVCVSYSVTLTDATPGDTWSSSNTALATINSSGIVTGLAAGVPNITYQDPTTSCYALLSFTVNDNPAAIAGSPFAVCTGSTNTVTDVTPSGTWSSSNALLASITTPGGVITGNSIGVPTISYVLSTGCYALQSYTVNQTPVATTGASQVCIGATTTLTNTTGGGSWSSSDGTKASVSGTGVVTGIGAGSVTISYILSTGCFSVFPMTVNSNPNAIGGPTSVCVGTTITATETTGGGTWASSNSGIASVVSGTGVITGITAGNATISYTVGATGCFNTEAVSVNTNPTTISGTTGICIGGSSILSSSPAGGNWSSSNTGVATVIASGVGAGTVTPVAVGTSNITYTLSSGCFIATTVTINPLPAAISGSSSVCVGTTVTLTDGGGGLWASSNPGDASVGAGTGIVTGITGGTTPTITYTLPTGCSVTQVESVNSNPATIGGTTTACVGLTSVLNDGTSGGTWSTSNSSIATVVASGAGAGTVTGVAAGTATITYTLATGCFSTTIFTVNPLPSAIAGTMAVCTGATTALTDASGAGTWSSNDITIASVSSTTGVVTGVSAGSTTISYTLATGCYSTATVTVNQTPVSITGTTSVCVGLTTTLNDATAGGTWSSNNTALASVVSGTGVVTGNAAGVPTISYMITATGCYATTPVTVNANPAVPAGTTAVCVGSTTLLTDATVGGTWSSSDPSLGSVGASTGLVAGVSAGTITITYTLPTGCINTVSVVINPLPAAISGTFNVCTGFTTLLGDATAGGTWASNNTTLATVVASGVGAGTVSGLVAGVPTISYTLSATGCYVTQPVTVNSTPPAITGTTNVCVGSTTTLSDATTGGLWSSSNATYATVDASSGTVTGVSAAGVPNITYTVPTGCFVSTPVTVNPLPAGITGVTNVCIGLTTTLADATPSGSWTSSNTAEASVVSGTGVVTGNATGVPNITYTLPTTGCYTSTPVTVNPNPSAITGVTSVCTGFTTTFASTTTGGTWSSSSTSVATVGAGTGVVTGVGAGTATISYVLPTGCLAIQTVTVNQTPAAITGVTNVCIGLTTTLADATPSGSWSSSNLSQATVVSGTGVVTGVATGVPVISYVMGTGCFVTTPVTVNPNPVAITGATTVCTGSTIGLADASAGGTWTSSDPTVGSVGSATGVVTGVSAGSITITYAFATGCQVTYGVTVNTTPSAITGVTNVCTGFTTTLADATTTGTWSSSNTAEATVVSATGVVTGVTSGTPTISYTMGTGCYAVAPITVNQTPAATTGTPDVCVGSTTVLSDVTAGGTWSSTDPSEASVGSSTGIVTGIAAGTLTISYTMPTGCYANTPFTVNPTPAAVTGPGVVCAGSDITMADATYGGIWSSGNTTVATVDPGTGVVTGVAAGAVNIIYTLGAGCTASTTITVNPVPNISNFTSTIATSECAGVDGTVTVSSTSLGSGTFTLTYNLSGANAATGVSTTLTMGATNGTFTIPSSSLTVTGFTTVTITGISNGYSCTSIPLTNNASTFSVYPLPTVYNVTGGGGYCVGGAGVHVYLSNSVGGINYQLMLGATPVGAPVAGTFSGLDFGAITTVGTYSVTATNATTGCTSNMFGSATIFTNPLPTNTYTVTGGGSYCAGGTGVAVGLSSSDGGISYQLYIGGVSTGTAVAGSGTAITFGLQTAAGTYTVVGTNTSTTCTSNMTGSQTVVINPLPASISGTLFVCPGSTSTLADATTGGTWTSSTPSVATIGTSTGVVTGITAGTANIIYTLPTTCSTTSVVTVNPSPAGISGLTSVCAGSTITLTDATGGGTWSSSNTLLATVGVSSGIVSGVASGTPTITYTLSTGCYVTFNITVNPTPAAIAGATSVCVGLTATVTDAVSGGTWTSSTPTLATIGSSSGIVNGVAPGTLTLTYTLPAGCNVTTPFTVNPTPAGITGTASVCVGSITTLADATSGGTWNSSNTAVATVGLGSGNVTGISAGTATITYALPAGCTAVTNVTVNPIPAAITGTNNVCVGLTTPLANSVAGGTWSSSNTSFATIGSATGVVTGVAAGSVTITYTLPAGCSVTYGFTVNPLPSAITGTASVCAGSSTTLADALSGGTWASSNTTEATVGATTGIVNGLVAGTPIITYTLPTGCLITVPVTVNPLPLAITGTPTMCAGATTTLSDASSGGTWTSSNTAVAGAGSSTGIITGVSAGNATITYTLPTTCLATTGVTVYPSPATISGAPSVCVGLTTTLTDGVSGGSWSSSNALLASIGAGTGVVTGNAVGTPAITYTLPAPGSCFTTRTETVNPQPVAITGVFSVCAGSATNLSDATTGGSWSSSNTAIGTVDAVSGIVTGISAGTVTITYTLPAGCFVIQNIVVNATPVAITGTPNVCIGLTTTLADATTGGTWTISGSSATIVGSTGVVTGVSAGTPVVTYTTLPGSCIAVYPITVNALPVAITGVTSVCVGANTTLSDATAGGAWTSSNSAVATITGFTGVATGVTAGTLTFTYTLPTGCITTTTGTVNALPNIYTLTGGGTYCSGGAGSTVGLSNSDLGVIYQLMNGTTTVGTAVAGTGSPISFGTLFTAATYTVVATNTTTSCTSNMSGSATISVSVLPTVFNMTGGGGYCSGSTGVAVGLDGSTTGVNYQLYFGMTPMGAAVAGTGSAFNFGTYTGAGSYTVVATNGTTGCTNNMAGVSIIVINPLPTAFTVTGGGVNCSGTTTPVHIGLSNSTTGVNYTLVGGTSVTLPGSTGSALDFGPVSTAATYSVTAQNTTTTCSNTMIGTAIVTTSALPTAFTLTSSGANPYCAGGAGVTLNLSGSTAAFSYQLYLAGSPVGTPITGTGSALTFGLQTAAGAYTVIATNNITGCTKTMTGTINISINPAPHAFHVLSGSGGTYCSGSGGVSIYVDSTVTGVNYSLYVGGSAYGYTIAGTGSAITYTGVTTAGTYTVLATTTATGCTNTLVNTAVVSIAPLPVQYNLTSVGAATYCPGGTGVSLSLSNSDLGVSYQLYNGATLVTTTAGTGGALTFGPLTSGSYSVVAKNSLTSCTSTMNGSPVAISTYAAMATYSLSSGGSYCAGGSGVDITLSGSASGVNYQLYNSGVIVSSGFRAGTTGPLDFGNQTATGIYTVLATNVTTSCTVNMTGSAVVTITSLPAANNVTGGGSYCAGGTGVPVGTDGSFTGLNYQLYLGGTMLGSPIAGTGSPLSFGNQALAGNYTVIRTSATTGCSGAVSGSANVTVNAAPVSTYSVTGGGGYCAGGTGALVGLSSSDTGVSYQLYNGTATTGLPVAGTGSAISFGMQTSVGIRTVVATRMATGCTATMTGSVVIVINPTPAVDTVTGGGAYCSGGSGKVIGLNTSSTGINYQLYLGTSVVGAAVPGTGTLISFGSQTGVGTYTVQAISATTGCTSAMTGAAVISLSPLPVAYSITGGGGYCVGGTGSDIMLGGSASGVSYQLYRGTSPVGIAMIGTGSAIDFGLQTALGNYTVVATSPVTTCSGNMTGTVIVSLNPLPVAYNMTGGGSYCAGGAGLAVGLSNSDASISYQLYRDGVAIGAPLAGTGAALNFGLQTVNGSYTVIGTNSVTSCVSMMSGSVPISINALPLVYSVGGGGAYCAGGAGQHITLSSSDLGINYQLQIGGVNTGGLVAGVGGALDFGLQTGGGSYTVVATNGLSSCISNMGGSATITVNPLPVATYVVTGGGGYCEGGTGLAVGLSGSNSGINYQLYNGTATSGLMVPGTGSPLNFGLETVAGTYSVVATNAATTCQSNMTDSVMVVVNPLPVVDTVTGGGNYCPGGAGQHIGLSSSTTGILYQLYRGIVALGAPTTGTGSGLDFGLQSVVGTYFVTATNSSTGCAVNMVGSPSIGISALPTAYTVMASSTGYCLGGSGVDISLSGSDVGTQYQLMLGTVAVGAPMAGTGFGLDYGLQTSAGTYSVVATSSSSTCTSNMTGTPSIVINSLPTAYSVTGGGAYCVGGTGVHVFQSGSDIGVNYQLYKGTTVVGTMAGTSFSLDFGTEAGTGIYTVIGTNTSTGCTSNMLSSASIAVNPLPTNYFVVGGGSYCAGGPGVHVGLNNSDSGINYQLYMGTTPVASLGGTNLAIDFGAQSAAGNYTVVANNPVTGCSANMSDSAVVSINALPTAFTITGGGNYCTGGTGVHIGLSSSVTGVTYQLQLSGSGIGAPLTGTGAALDFGLIATTGSYTIMATSVGTGCTNTMAGSVVVSISSLPAIETVTGGGNYCASTPGVSIGLGGSEVGVNYQLYNGIATVGGVVAGTGGTLSFGLHAAGTYTVVAINATTACTSNMAGSATATAIPTVVPSVSVVTGVGDTVCTGTSVTFSALPVNGGLVPGYSWSVNGGVISGATNSSYTYTPANGNVVSVTMASNADCPLPATANGSVTMTVRNNVTPSVTIAASPSNKICQGTTVVVTATPVNGGTAPSYSWELNGAPVSVGSSFTFIPSDSAIIFCTMTSSYQCVSVNTVLSNDITFVTETNLQPVVSISLSSGMNSGTVLYNDTLTAAVVNPGHTPTYQWVINGVVITGANAATLYQNTLNDGDLVSCEVTDSNACGALVGESSITVHSSNVGVKQVANGGNSLSLVPNPNNGVFTVKGTLTSTDDQEVTIEVTDVLGQVISTTKVMTHNGIVDEKVQISGTIANGMYMVNVHTANENKVFHMVVEQ